MRFSENYFKRRLPHIDLPGASYFVTFRLEGSIPKCKLAELSERYHDDMRMYSNVQNDAQRNSLKFKRRKLFFKQYDDLLDRIISGPTHLKNPEIANILKEQLHRFDGELYDLNTYTIMSNHAHILIDSYLAPRTLKIDPDPILGALSLSKIMKRIKGPSALYSNRVLQTNEQFWAHESFDMYMRNQRMYDNVSKYILNNPVKAKIVKRWQDYEWNYLAK